MEERLTSYLHAHYFFISGNHFIPNRHHKAKRYSRLFHINHRGMDICFSQNHSLYRFVCLGLKFIHFLNGITQDLLEIGTGTA